MGLSRILGCSLLGLAGVGACVAALTAASAATSRPKAETSGRAETTLWFGGDVNLGEHPRDIFAPLSQILKGEAGIVNLEGPVAFHFPAGAGLKLVNAPSGLGYLRTAGVRVATIANNHASDAGPHGMEETAEALRQSRLVAAGGPAGAGVVRVRDWLIVVAAYDLTPGVPKDLAGSLRAARERADVLVASFHVTGPDSYLPRPELRKAVAIALKAGARIIVAHGTHAIGPVERRDDAVIAWGLGNLAFSCDCTKEHEGVLLRVNLSDDEPLRATVIPIAAGLLGEPTRLAEDPKGTFDLLAAIGSSKLERRGAEADF